MKMNEIIRKYRKEANLTQEQVANYLGVTAPAVNKWEKGSCYPDVTLLVPLARILRTDVNTLTGFGGELTDREVSVLVNELSDLISKEGAEAGFARGQELIREYPTSDALILRVAQTLDIFCAADVVKEAGGTFSVPVNPLDRVGEKYISGESQARLRKLLSWYELVASGTDPYLSGLAKISIVSKYMELEEYEKAQKLLDELSDPRESTAFNRIPLQATLYFKTGKEQEGYRVYESRIRQDALELSAILTVLMERNMKEGRQEEAEVFARTIRDVARIFDLGEYQSRIPDLYLGMYSQDPERTLSALEGMVESYETNISMNSDSPLYRHLKKYPASEDMRREMKRILLSSLRSDKGVDFLREEAGFRRLMAALEREEASL